MARTLKTPSLDLEDGDVERPAAEIVDGGQAVLLGVEPVGQAGGRRLVDDALDLEAADRGGVLGGLALSVVEMGRHGDDRLRHRLAEEGLGAGLEIAQDHRRDLRRAQGLVAQDDGDVAVGGLLQPVRQLRQGLLDLGRSELLADQALDRIEGVGRVGGGLAPGQGADEALPGCR